MRPRYCCFYLHQRLRLAWVRSEAGGHVELVLADGSVARQRAANVLYAWDGEEAPDDGAALEQLEHHAEGVTAQQAHADALYAAMEAGAPEPFDALVRRLSPAPQGWAQGLLFCALLLDTRRFRYSNGSFTARSAQEVAERSAAERRREEEDAWLTRVEVWREHLEASEWSDTSAEGQAFLEQLRSVLALEKRSPFWPLLSRPLGLHNLHLLDVAARIKGWLRVANAWPEWPAIWLQWAEVPPAFPAPLLEAAAPLAAAPARRQGRRESASAAVYTIDSEGTLDFDDALAVLDADANGLTVAVHIAEPDPALEPGHPLFDEAARRMASVYTLEGVFPMFPEVLSTGRFSLVQGAEREVVTFVLRMEADEARLVEVQRGLVQVERNLDYGAAQELLYEQPATWGRLAELCADLAQVRAAMGAVIMERRETLVDISDPQRIRLREVVRSGPVHRMVEELAILHNREAGRYCRDHRLPGIYRVQPAPRRAPNELDTGAEMQMAARFTTRGAMHSGLACDRYIQTTSPIRRFPDLVMQRQIAGHMATGRVTFTHRDELEAWAGLADARMATYDEVSRRIASDWKRRYLEQNRNVLYQGIARRPRDDEHGRVWLEPLHLQARCVLPGAVRDGDPVRVRVDAVDRDHQTVWVTCVE